MTIWLLILIMFTIIYWAESMSLNNQREITQILKRVKRNSISDEVNKNHFRESTKYKNTVIDTTLPKFINLFSAKANLWGRTTRWQISFLLKQLNINRDVSLKIWRHTTFYMTSHHIRYDVTPQFVWRKTRLITLMNTVRVSITFLMYLFYIICLPIILYFLFECIITFG